MKPASYSNLVVCLVCTLIALTACSPTAVPVAPVAAAASLDATAAPLAPIPSTHSGAITTLDGVKSATIRIVAEGSYADPEQGNLLETWSGSGFIIDESGLAVTNNHVVTGAGMLTVYVGGEHEPRHARIVAVSECSDLALIDIDGDGFPYLEWYPDAILVGLEVYAAGFPLGDPEFTLTRGIVSKEHASGDTQWASINYTIEHDAKINPGNSGGPLITKDGQVVGVNYAENKSTNQYFAIARDEAVKIIDRLRNGKNVESLGINGEAMTDGQDVSGIWVSSVQSGSPAGLAGLKPGDFILEMEGLPLATDGTLADYCNILRSHDANATLAIRVARPDTNQFLEGEFSGRKLEPVASPVVMASPTPTRYRAIADESGALKVEVPSTWTDIDDGDWSVDDNVIGAAVTAAPDLAEFFQYYNAPGVLFGASRSLAKRYTVTAFLNHMQSDYESCTYLGRTDYEDSLYTGQFDMWTNCGSTDSVIVHLVAAPASRAFLIYVEIQVAKENTEVADHIANSFVVSGDLP